MFCAYLGPLFKVNFKWFLDDLRSILNGIRFGIVLLFLYIFNIYNILYIRASKTSIISALKLCMIFRMTKELCGVEEEEINMGNHHDQMVLRISSLNLFNSNERT
jgi:hypothetical protein